MNFKELFIGNFPPGPQHRAQRYNIHKLIKKLSFQAKLNSPTRAN